MKGYFGEYGGQHVPGEMKQRLDELEKAFEQAIKDPAFGRELRELLKDYVGRPSPLYHAHKLSTRFGAKIYLKREDLNHTGAHKINNAIGQALLAKRMGKRRMIAETGAGQHGVATATVAALMGMDCEIFMGEVDAEKQRMNLLRMQLLGAKVTVVKEGQRTLKEAVDAALDSYVREKDTFYLLGSAVGPHPYPTIVRHFQRVIGEEAKAQIMEQEGRIPDFLVACVGGGSNAIGLFHAFSGSSAKMIGIEPAGRGLGTGKHAATLTLGKPGIIHGFYSYLLTDKDGKPADVYSIASGLDYPGVGPEHSHLKDIGAAEYVTITDSEAIDAFHICSEEEGIIPALESSHALAHAFKLAERNRDSIIIVNLSGRGDKDVDFVCSMS